VTRNTGHKWWFPAAALVLLGGSVSRLAAHDIPASVVVQAFIKPQGSRLHLLVRVPLQSMRDMEIPQRDRGYLDIGAVQPELRNAAQLWIAEYVQVYEGDSLLPSPRVAAVQVSLPSDRSFTSYDEALAHVSGPPLPDSTDLPWQQAMLDVLLDYTIRSDLSTFSIRPELAHLGVRTTTVLRFLPPGRAERDFEYAGNPGLVRLDPRWYQAALTFVRLGFFHILDGIDHLLFVFCLVIPFRRPRPLIAIITSFTIAHSITLIASAFGLAPNALWFPPLIETLIALSILYMALENIVGPRLERRWVIAFGFGLVHGFGFSFALRRSLQFAGAHLLTSLFSFNVGVEMGQILVLAVAIPALAVLFRFVVAERVGTILLSAIVAHTAWHWMMDRLGVLRQYQFEWPVLNATFLIGAMRALMLILILAGTMWALFVLYGRLMRPSRSREAGVRVEG
jgi:HupE/UreJ protein